MTSHDNVTDIVERLGWHHEHPVTGALVLRNHDGPEAADTIATLRKQLENARSEALEEAAKVVYKKCEPYNPVLGLKIEAAIRALKGKS